MFNQYIKTLFKKLNHYNSKAQNPFLNNQEYNPFKSLYEQTYIWVENQKNE